MPQSSNIFFTFGQNNNGSLVQYAIWFEEKNIGGSITNEGFLAADGSDAGGAGSEVWQTYATWTTVVTAINLTAQMAYRFKVKAKSEEGVETAFSSFSATMSPFINLAYSPLSNSLLYEWTTGDCKIGSLAITGSSNAVTIGYTLYREHNVSTKTNVKIYYSTAARILIDPDDYTEITSSGAITGDTGTLTASVAGTDHTNTWATCTTLGNSYYGTIYVKVVPYDTATAGDAGEAAVTTVTIDNRPLAITIAEISNFTWDKDRPEIIAPMSQIVCGNYMYFVCRVFDANGTEVMTISSAEVIDGWYYEQDHAGHPGSTTRYPASGWDTNWTAVTTYGVPAAYLPPTLSGNCIRYIFQTDLTQGQTYTIKMQQAEIVSVLV